MDKFKAWLEDRKNLPIVAGATGVLVVGVLVFVLYQLGVIGGGAAPPPMPGPEGQTAADLGAPPTDASAGVPPQTAPGTPPAGGMPADTGAPPTTVGTTATGAAPAPGGGGAAMPPMLPYRKDPFMSFAGIPTKTQALMAIVPSVRHIRIAPARVTIDSRKSAEEPAPEDLVPPPQPFRRVAGVLWNSKVKALLETEGEIDVVQPGDVLTRGGSKVRVESIDASGVTLKTLDTPVPLPIRVGLAGSIAGRQPGSETITDTGSPYTTPEGPPPGIRGPSTTGEGPPPGWQ